MADTSIFPTALQLYAAASSPKKGANVALNAVNALPISASGESSNVALLPMSATGHSGLILNV